MVSTYFINIYYIHICTNLCLTKFVRCLLKRYFQPTTSQRCIMLTVYLYSNICYLMLHFHGKVCTGIFWLLKHNVKSIEVHGEVQLILMPFFIKLKHCINAIHTGFFLNSFLFAFSQLGLLRGLSLPWTKNLSVITVKPICFCNYTETLANVLWSLFINKLSILCGSQALVIF